MVTFNLRAFRQPLGRRLPHSDRGRLDHAAKRGATVMATNALAKDGFSLPLTS